MFAVILTYHKPIEEIEKHTATHRAWLDQLYTQNVLIMSGPQIPRTGGVLIATGGRSKEELWSILQQDPFHTEGIATYEIYEFNPIKHIAALKDHVT